MYCIRTICKWSNCLRLRAKLSKDTFLHYLTILKYLNYKIIWSMITNKNRKISSAYWSIVRKGIYISVYVCVPTPFKSLCQLYEQASLKRIKSNYIRGNFTLLSIYAMLLYKWKHSWLCTRLLIHDYLLSALLSNKLLICPVTSGFEMFI